MSLCPHGYTAFYDCPHCEEPMGTALPSTMLDAIPGVCSKCHENTTFEMDPYEQELMSVCCWRPMWNPPEEADTL